MNKIIAVTGASGHIGNVVCRLLLNQGYRVKALYHSDFRSLKGLNVESLCGDVLNKVDLAQLMEGCDVVINCAAIISIHGDPTGIVFKTNTDGPANVLEAAYKQGVKRLIHISSVHAVEEQPRSLPFDEKRHYKTAASDVYDYSKAIGEQRLLERLQENPLELIILRPSSVIGRYDFKPSEMGKALLDFYNQKIPALPEGGFDFVDVRDVAKSVITSIEKGIPGEIYLISGKYYTLKELAKIVSIVTGKNVPGLVIPYRILNFMLPLISFYSKITKAAPLFTQASIDTLKNGHPLMDSTKAAKVLNHTIRPLEETIRDFYEWQKSIPVN